MHTKLQGNYPNPFNPETTISYSVNDPSVVKIEIYNIKGQKVKTLVNELKQRGMHSVVWNGNDEDNRSVSSGIYFYKLHSGHITDVQKMVLMK
ncbi:MAG: T9SS type A sorting domain-containing protein [Candidatus Cloacimonetes bacterium]|nr:T9SS type A sorting domain-containing protein [Candidatus Cloacimonadota bacterium]